MKKIFVLLFSITALFVATNSYAVDAANSASQTKELVNPTATSDINHAQTKTEANSANPANQETQNTIDMNNILTAQLKLMENENHLYAYIILSQTQNLHGTVHVHWIAPEHSGCTNSVYPLNYQYKSFHTRAFRTVVRDDNKGGKKVCAGTWTAKVLDVNNNVLATSQFEVLNKPVPTTAQAPAAKQPAAETKEPTL